MSKKALIVIPARMASTRFPGKPLAVIAGQTMLERVWRIAKAVPNASRVVIATDDPQIQSHAESFGAEALLTGTECETGTDRVAQAAGLLDEHYDIVFSFQGDSVLTPPSIIEKVLEEMLADESVEIGTAAVRLEGEALSRLREAKARGSTTGTCVVFDHRRNALYFSKGLLPFPRDRHAPPPPVHLHIGLYGYRRAVLERFAALEPSALEQIEKLEQLRALENGIPIRVVVVDTGGRTLHSVDAPEDALEAEEIIKREGELLG